MRRVAGAALAAAVVVGCGSSGSGNPVLQRDAAGIASAARAGDATAVRVAVDQLRRDIAVGQAAGSVSAEQARRVLAAAAALASDLPTPPPSATPLPRVTSSPTRESDSWRGKKKEHHNNDGDHGD